MRLLVTGGLGFIGSNFILNTIKNNDEISITNVDAELLGSNHNNLLELKNLPNYNFVKGNITNKVLMEKLIADTDAIINFAAETFVDRSILDANQFLVSNIRGTYTILETIRKQKKNLEGDCIYRTFCVRKLSSEGLSRISPLGLMSNWSITSELFCHLKNTFFWS